MSKSRLQHSSLLSERQKQILSLLSDGKSNKEISTDLQITPGTVKQHMVMLFRKLGVTSRAKAVNAARSLIAQDELRNAYFVKRSVNSYFETRYVWRMISSVTVVVRESPPTQPSDFIRFDRLLADLRQYAKTVVDAYDGSYIFLPGGGLVAWFGHPVAHLDDADRAVAVARLIHIWCHAHEVGFVGVGVASHSEMVADKSSELYVSESMRLSAVLAHYSSKLLATPLTRRITSKLIPWSSLPESAGLPVPALALESTRSFVSGNQSQHVLPFLDDIAETVKSSQAQWLSIESWPPSTVSPLMDAIGMRMISQGFSLIRFRTPSLTRRDQLLASIRIQLELYSQRFGTTKPTGGSGGEYISRELANLSAEKPLLVQVYGPKGLDAFKSTLGEKGIELLVSCPILIVAANTKDIGQSQTAIRLLGSRGDGMPFSRLFTLAQPDEQKQLEQVRFDLQSLIDGVSERSRELLFRVAEKPDLSIEKHMDAMRCSFSEAQHILHEITSAGLFSVKQSGGFEMRDSVTAAAVRGLRVETEKR